MCALKLFFLWAAQVKIMREFMREKKTTAVLLWVHYERVSHFQFWSWVSEVYEKSAWATHVSSLRPDIQSALTNVRPTKLNTNARDIRGPTDRWVLKGYLWADYERIMRGLWEDYESRASRCFRFLLSGRLRVHSFLWELKYIRIQAYTNAHPRTNELTALPPPLWAD